VAIAHQNLGLQAAAHRGQSTRQDSYIFVVVDFAEHVEKREFGQWPRELPTSRTPIAGVGIAGVEVVERLFLRRQLEWQ
jgi:hypothetical protein